MAGLMVALAVLAVLDLDGFPLLDRLEGLLWVVLAGLAVLTLRVLETRAGRTANGISELREVRDVVRRTAGSVGRISERLARLESPPAPTKTNGPPPAATAAPARARAAATPPDEVHQSYGRHTAPTLDSVQQWQPVADWVAVEPARRPAGLVAVVGVPDTLREVMRLSNGVALMPGYALSLIERSRPRLVVLDRMALTSGAWSCAETAIGVELLQELTEVAAWARKRSVPVYWLEAPGADGPNSAALRALSTVQLPRDEAALSPEGARNSELVVLLHRLAAARCRPVGTLLG